MSGFWDRVVGSGAPVPSGTAGSAPPPQHLMPTPAKTPSAHQSSTCPGCGSGHYMAPPNAPQHPRCFDCGYPKLHSTSGLIAGPSDGPPTPARIQSPSSPSIHQIVHRIG